MFKRLTIGCLLIIASMANLAYAGDPTRPAYLDFSSTQSSRVVKRVAPLKALQLGAIFYSQQRKLAIINNQILRVGERIAGAQIVEIERSQVTVVRHGKRRVLMVIKAPSIKTNLTPANAADPVRKANENSDASKGAP